MGLKARSKPVVLYSVVSNLIIYQKLDKSQTMWLQGEKSKQKCLLIILKYKGQCRKANPGVNVCS